ncbi:MAG: hypothetical protein WBJ81_04395, partial [Rickettsiales bacterium]
MQVLEYSDLDYSGLESKYLKIKSALESEDYYTAQVKKLKNHALYSARLDYTNRILFKFAKYQNQKYILILEIIRNHNYEGAKFLNGVKVIEEIADDIISSNKQHDSQDFNIEDIKYINTN